MAEISRQGELLSPEDRLLSAARIMMGLADVPFIQDDWGAHILSVHAERVIREWSENYAELLNATPGIFGGDFTSITDPSRDADLYDSAVEDLRQRLTSSD